MKDIHRNASKRISVRALIVSIILLTGISTAHSAPPDAEMCSFLERFHGHTCPGSLMGLRLGLAAKEALNAQGRITAKTLMLACSVDGIQVATGATIGNRALTLEDRGEMALILTDVQTDKQVEARLTQEAMNRAKIFRELSGNARTMDDGSPEQVNIKKKLTRSLTGFAQYLMRRW
ncbi:MAG: formylmethanofuran dehydrogenase subunit E family protein [Deltaproteobacteria bacterium]|nr:formylmethanofuran dehydrogenase subunit E family protein [Deltaproteobacteria bacterium]